MTVTFQRDHAYSLHVHFQYVAFRLTMQSCGFNEYSYASLSLPHVES